MYSTLAIMVYVSFFLIVVQTPRIRQKSWSRSNDRRDRVQWIPYENYSLSFLWNYYNNTDFHYTSQKRSCTLKMRREADLHKQRPLYKT